MERAYGSDQQLPDWQRALYEGMLARRMAKEDPASVYDHFAHYVHSTSKEEASSHLLWNIEPSLAVSLCAYTGADESFGCGAELDRRMVMMESGELEIIDPESAYGDPEVQDALPSGDVEIE